jgi:hypothetical protein
VELEYYLPISPKQVSSYHLSKRPNFVEDITIGLIDNTKKNADLLLQSFAKLIEKTYKNITFKYYRKPNSSTPFKEIPTIAQECNYIINAHGD